MPVKSKKFYFNPHIKHDILMNINTYPIILGASSSDRECPINFLIIFFWQTISQYVRPAITEMQKSCWQFFSIIKLLFPIRIYVIPATGKESVKCGITNEKHTVK